MIKKRFKNKTSLDPSKPGNIDFILIKENQNYNDIEVDIKRASEVIPKWYKDTPLIVDIGDGHEDFSMKKCIPVLDSLSLGYMVVTKYNYHFKYDKEKEEFSVEIYGANKEAVLENVVNVIQMHPATQAPEFPFSDDYFKYIFKWNCSYMIKTPAGYGCLFTHPLNYSYLPFYTLSGVVDTDKFPFSVLFPFIMKKNDENFIPAGTPIAQIIPFKKEGWKSKVFNKVPIDFVHQTHQITREYIDARTPGGQLKGGIYRERYRNVKKYL